MFLTINEILPYAYSLCIFLISTLKMSDRNMVVHVLLERKLPILKKKNTCY